MFRDWVAEIGRTDSGRLCRGEPKRRVDLILAARITYMVASFAAWLASPMLSVNQEHRRDASKLFKDIAPARAFAYFRARSAKFLRCGKGRRSTPHRIGNSPRLVGVGGPRDGQV